MKLAGQLHIEDYSYSALMRNSSVRYALTACSQAAESNFIAPEI